MKWPAQSPDLNPIEHLWQQLKAKLQQYDTSPKGVHELWDRVAKEWTKGGSYRVLDCKIIEGQKTAPMADYFV